MEENSAWIRPLAVHASPGIADLSTRKSLCFKLKKTGFQLIQAFHDLVTISILQTSNLIPSWSLLSRGHLQHFWCKVARIERSIIQFARSRQSVSEELATKTWAEDKEQGWFCDMGTIVHLWKKNMGDSLREYNVTWLVLTAFESVTLSPGSCELSNTIVPIFCAL